MQSHAHKRGNSRIKSSRIRFAFKDSVQNPLCRTFPVGWTPGERSQQSGRPAPPVRSRRGPPSPEQFGCGIARGTGNEAGLGQPGLVLSHRDTEVNEHGATRRTDDIGGFDVAMNNSARMNIFKRLSKGTTNRGNTTDVQCSSGKKFRQCRTGNVFTDDEGLGSINLNI